MKRILRVGMGIVGLAGTVGISGEASARLCSSNNDHGCWAIADGANMDVVAVGGNPGAPGIACASSILSGSVHCYQATGSSGAITKIHLGEEVGSSYFNWGEGCCFGTGCTSSC